MPTIYFRNVRPFKLLAVLGLILILPFLARAQNNGTNAVSSDFLNVYNTSSDKAVQLAEAIPAEKFQWRPADGVRSVQEVVLHLTSATYFFASKLGATIPEDVELRGLENSDMSKEDAVAALKGSIKFAQNAIQQMKSEDYEAKTDFFGNEVSKRQALFVLGDHTAEHLGQLIAYARMNDVTPPWSRQESE